jgi:hypothetical protein
MRLSILVVFLSPLTSIPCKKNSSSPHVYSGVITHFDDDVYQCYEWNGKAKDAMKSGHLFAAANYKLASPDPSKYKSEFKLDCGVGNYDCIKQADGREYMLIDWCDKSNCDFHSAGHADILVEFEDLDTDECVLGCDGYDTFKNKWTIVPCSNQLNPDDF